jgi:hypothetical protein
MSEKRKILLKILALLLVTTCLSFLYFGSIKRQVFDWDEYNFLKKAYYLDLYVARDFADSRWYDSENGAQPKVGPYIYAIALKLTGVHNFDNYFAKIHFNDFFIGDKLWYEYYLWKVIPPPENGDFVPIYRVLTVGRIASTLFFLATLTLVFLAASRIKGFGFALVSVIAIGFTNAFLVLGRVAMTDNMLLFFLYLGLYLSIVYKDLLSDEKRRSGIFPISFLLGVCAAFGAGVKITGILIILFITLFFLILDLTYKNKIKIRNLLVINYLLILFVFTAVFYLLHPYLYKNTLYNFYYMFDGRLQGALEFQFQDPNLAVLGKFEAFKLLIKRSLIFFDDSPYVYFPVKVVNVLFFVYGTYKLCKSLYDSFVLNKIVNSELVFCLWLFVLVLFLPFYLSGDYLRYYLPVISGFVVVGAYGFAEFIKIYIWKKKISSQNRKVS